MRKNERNDRMKEAKYESYIWAVNFVFQLFAFIIKRNDIITSKT